MKLVDILARELKVWPEGNYFAWQDYDREIRFSHTTRHDFHASILADDHVRSRHGDDPDYGVSRAEWQAAVDALNSPKVVEWDEFGFPPAGVSCEFTTNDGHNWKGCKILYADELSILTGELEGKADRRLLRKCDADVKFRPARTAEQVAAEEREKAIKEMMMHGVDAGDSTIEYSCAALYDAGYRKEPKPCGS